MRLQLNGRDLNYCISNYSIVGNLLFNIVAQTSNQELFPWERIFIVRSLNLPVHPGYLAGVYMACGCFSEARTIYQDPAHPRKLGDICWCEGKLDEAELYYSRLTGNAQKYRSSPDDDRLIKLAFCREQWDQVVTRFANASFGRWNPPHEVTLGNSVTRAKPYLDMLAVAACRLNSPIPATVSEVLKSAFGISKAEWEDFRNQPIHLDIKTVSKLKTRCRPRVGATEPLSVEAAIRKGNTARANYVLEYIRNADHNLELAQNALENFAISGEETELERFLQLVTGSGIASISQSFLFSALGHDSFPGNRDIPPERLVRLFSSHSVMNKRHLGKLLDLRFNNQLPVTASDVLTGVFQMLATSNFSDAAGHNARNSPRFDVPRLASCREWACIRLEEWLNSGGAKRADGVAEVWRDGKAQAATHPFYLGVTCTPQSPRNSTEWNNLMADALTWLEKRWEIEIGTSRWVAENQLYQILRRLLKGAEVAQHARPTWLEPQHLDIYVPQADVAIEYMGQQHYEPLEFFGGEAAFRLLIERDKKKALLCEKHGVTLIRVRFDEDIGKRGKEIAEEVSSLLKVRG